MLPQAKIIHCRRDPRDTALSLWSQHFAHDDMAWSYDFGDIAEFAGGYARLMQHWTQQLDLPIFELDYEALVADTEASLAQVRAFLGLEADASTPQADAAEVFATASVWQARQRSPHPFARPLAELRRLPARTRCRKLRLNSPVTGAQGSWRGEQMPRDAGRTRCGSSKVHGNVTQFTGGP